MPECQTHVFPIKLASVDNLKDYLYPSMIFPTRHPEQVLSIAHNQVTGGSVTIRTVPNDAINYLYGWMISGCSESSAGNDYLAVSVNRVAPLVDLVLTKVHAPINKGIAMAQTLLVPLKLTAGDEILFTAQPASMKGWCGILYTDE